MPGIFISYRRNDTDGHAGRLGDLLIEDYGRAQIFMDIDSIDVGTQFRERIDSALDATNVTLVLIGRDWVGKPVRSGAKKRRIDREDDWVRREVGEALKRDDVTVVPVLVEGARMPKRSELPADLAQLPGIEYCELRNAQWSYDYRNLRRTLDQLDPDSWWKRASRQIRTATRQASAVKFGVGGAVVAAIIAAVLLISRGGGGGGGGGCANPHIPADVRAALATAAGQEKQAVENSVFYGTCGGRAFATAKFPDGTQTAFRQEGAHPWVALGPVSQLACRKIPSGVRSLWLPESGC